MSKRKFDGSIQALLEKEYTPVIESLNRFVSTINLDISIKFETPTTKKIQKKMQFYPKLTMLMSSFFSVRSNSSDSSTEKQDSSNLIKKTEELSKVQNL